MLSVQDTYSGVEWSPGELNLAGEYENLDLSTVQGVSDVNVVDVREVPTNQFLLRVEATLDCEFDAFVHKSDAYVSDEIVISSYDWNDHYVLAAVSQLLRCELDLVIDASDPEQHNIQILSMEPAAISGYPPQ